METNELENKLKEFSYKYLEHLLDRLEYLRKYEQDLLTEKPFFKSSKEIWQLNMTLVKDEIFNLELKIKQEQEDLNRLSFSKN